MRTRQGNRKKTRSGGWRFDSEVAARFDREARSHIPNYETVVDKCVQIANSAFPLKDARIIDVGSATGYTMERLVAAGFTEVYGVDSSLSMIEECRLKDRVIHSESFPRSYGPFDLILANWTLHFIPKRAEYLRDVYESLSDGGIFILSDKMSSSSFVHDRYHDFKRAKGVSEEEIARKAAAVKGVLVPHSLERYLQTLASLGFREVSIIDAHWSFATLIAFK